MQRSVNTHYGIWKYPTATLQERKFQMHPTYLAFLRERSADRAEDLFTLPTQVIFESQDIYLQRGETQQLV